MTLRELNVVRAQVTFDIPCPCCDKDGVFEPAIYEKLREILINELNTEISVNIKDVWCANCNIKFTIGSIII